MRTAKLILCLLVASLAVLSIVEAGTTVFQSAVKRKTAGDRFGAFSVCGAPALFGGNRPSETVTNTMLRVPVFTSSFGIITTNSLPRNRNVTGNVALLVDLRAYTMLDVTERAASNQVWAFDVTNCTYRPLANRASWSFYMNYNGSSIFPADVNHFSGAIVNKRYPIWAGGERADGSVIDNAFVIDSTTDAISGASLSAARSGVAAVTATDGTAWFAGGIDRLNKQVFDNVDVFSKTLAIDSTTFKLSEPRGFAAGASLKGIVMIGGGVANYTETGNGTVVVTYSKTVDLYNLSTKKHTTHELSVARGMLTATASKDFILFAGGITSSVYNASTWALIEETNSDRIDVYHVASGTWSVALLGEQRAYLSSAAVDNGVVISAGSFFNQTSQSTAYSNAIDLFMFSYVSPASSLRASPIFAYIVSLFA